MIFGLGKRWTLKRKGHKPITGKVQLTNDLGAAAPWSRADADPVADMQDQWAKLDNSERPLLPPEYAALSDDIARLHREGMVGNVASGLTDGILDDITRFLARLDAAVDNGDEVHYLCAPSDYCTVQTVIEAVRPGTAKNLHPHEAVKPGRIMLFKEKPPPSFGVKI